MQLYAQIVSGRSYKIIKFKVVVTPPYLRPKCPSQCLQIDCSFHFKDQNFPLNVYKLAAPFILKTLHASHNSLFFWRYFVFKRSSTLKVHFETIQRCVEINSSWNSCHSHLKHLTVDCKLKLIRHETFAIQT